MKILITNGHLKAGGVEKSLVNLLNAIDYSNNEVDLLLFEGLGDYVNQIPDKVRVTLCDTTNTYGSVCGVIRNSIKERDIKTIIMKIIFTLSNKISMNFLWLMRLFCLVSNNYDYALGYRVDLSADFIAYAVKAKKKFVWWHNGQFDNSEKQVTQWKKMMKKMDGIVCVSEAAKNIILPHFSEFKNKMKVIPNIIDINDIKSKADNFHPYCNIDKHTIKIVSVGRLSKEKHMQDTVYVAKKLVEKKYKFVWYLIGDGIERENIENEITKLGIDENMVLVGNQSNPYPFIKDADIFVHPSYVESQGMAVLEAMALHKVSVVVESAGTKEFVLDGKNAVYSKQSIDSLFEKVEFAINNINNIDFSKCQDVTVSQFSPEKVLNEIFELENE